MTGGHQAGFSRFGLVFSILLLVAIFGVSACRRQGPAAISGFAFRDHDADGQRDRREPGEPGIVVTAYDVDGRFVVSTTTGVDGTFILGSADATSPIRRGQPYSIEFTGLPADLKPGPRGIDSGTELQFVTGGASNVGFGVLRADQYVPPGR